MNPEFKHFPPMRSISEIMKPRTYTTTLKEKARKFVKAVKDRVTHKCKGCGK